MRLHPALLVLLLAGCFDPGPGPAGWDADPDCANNSPPAIGNVELNSLEIIEERDEPRDDDDDSGEEVRYYTMSIHFDWVDPGVSGAEDPPNLVGGGYFSAEIFGFDTPDFPFTRGNLVEACVMPASEADPNPCAPYGHGSAGCTSEGAVDTCTQGELTIPLTSDQGGFPNDELVELEFRIRDTCGATSNEKSASYQPGTGLAVEGGGEGEE